MRTVFSLRLAMRLQFIWRLSSAAQNHSQSHPPYTTFRSFSHTQEVKMMYRWRADYVAALAEKDPQRQRQLVYQAILAIAQRRLSLVVGEEVEAMDEAEKSLKVLRRSMSEGRRKK